MVLTIAVYHDIGMTVERKTHENIQKYFDKRWGT